MQIVLASGSPRRKQLLNMLGLEFTVCPARGGEILPPQAGPEETVMALSRQKAAEVAGRFPADALIIAADTIVWHDGQRLGKPKNAADAAEMLSGLSGANHRVYTGVTLQLGDRVLTQAEETTVSFRALTPAEIQAYIATGEPMDKAGAYGIQGLASLFITGIQGDFFNVMGLPLCRLGKMLKEVGVELL